MFSAPINPQRVKKQNTRQLRKLGIDVVDHLPWIEPKSFRTPTDIAKRCVLLGALLQLHFGAPEEFISQYLEENDLLSCLSPQEEQILNNGYDSLSEQEKTNLYWSIEAIWALVWVGKMHNALTFNSSVDDSLAEMLPDFQKNEPARDFIENFSIHGEKSIFVALDKFYRAHWFARNLDVIGEKSDAVDLDIIMERRKALEWVADSSSSWDDIALDT